MSFMDEWLEEFTNWLTKEEEAEAYDGIFIDRFFPELPNGGRDTIERKVWRA